MAPDTACSLNISPCITSINFVQFPVPAKHLGAQASRETWGQGSAEPQRMVKWKASWWGQPGSKQSRPQNWIPSPAGCWDLLISSLTVWSLLTLMTWIGLLAVSFHCSFLDGQPLAKKKHCTLYTKTRKKCDAAIQMTWQADIALMISRAGLGDFSY